MGKGKQKKPPLQQGSLAVESYPALKKPLEHLGKKIDIPGSFWQYKGRVSEEDHNAVYKCTVLDFSLMHKFSPDGAYTQAFHLQEMGVDGTGSLEKSDIESTKFWVEYPLPFLRFYYATFPEEDPKHVQAADGGGGVVVDGGRGGSGSDRDGAVVDVALNPDVLADFPHVRLGRAPIYEFWSIKSDNLVTMGCASGSFRAEFQCLIVGQDGCECSAKRSIIHKRDKACPTSNLITHLREKAADGCEAHKAALKKVEAGDKNIVFVEGEAVLVHNFSEAFTYGPANTTPTPLNPLSEVTRPPFPLRQAPRGHFMATCRWPLVQHDKEGRVPQLRSQL